MSRVRFGSAVALTAVASLVGLESMVAHAAPLTNGGFESGMTGWSIIGDANAVTTFTYNPNGLFPPPPVTVDPTEGTQMALLDSGRLTNLQSTQTQVENFLGLSVGRLNTLSGGNPTRGSAIKQTFTANAGDTISFAWDFLTSDTTNVNDFSFASLVPNTPDAMILGSIASVGSFGNSGWQTFSYMLTASGTYTLGFGVMNESDNLLPSYLTVDNLRITPSATAAVPEPGEVADGLAVVGGLGILLMRRRFRRRKAALA